MEAATLAADRSQAFGIAIPVMIGWWFSAHPDFFGRKPETVEPEVAAGRRAGVAAVAEEVV